MNYPGSTKGSEPPARTPFTSPQLPASAVRRLPESHWYEIRTPSMSPLLLPGMLVGLSEPPLAPKLGDVVVWIQGGNVVCHRVVELGHDGRMRTKGDANLRSDQTIDVDDCLGKISCAVKGGSSVYRLRRSVRIARWSRRVDRIHERSLKRFGFPWHVFSLFARRFLLLLVLSARPILLKKERS